MSPFPMLLHQGTNSRSTGEPSFRAKTHEGGRRAGFDRGHMAASKAPGLGITPTRDVLGVPVAEIT